MTERISIIIPVYNEEERIGKTLEEYCGFFDKLKEIDWEIIAVCNACKDNSVEIVRGVNKKFKEIKLFDFEQGGKGFAIKEGFKEALKGKSELIGFIDADMATSPQAFYNLIKNIGKNDGIIASRYLKESIVRPKQPLDRIIASRVFNILIRSLFSFKFRDTQCGAKIFKRGVIERVLPELSISQWAFDIDLLYNCNRLGFKIKEQATVWSDASGSKIDLPKSSLQMFLAVCRLRAINSRFRSTWRTFKPISAFLYRITK